jgi:NAD(P)-dependent dehydrogenase (short-subunit alcohol dehydrogenase family)
MKTLENKSAVITGAGGGIGGAIAKRFAKAGANLIIAEFDAEKGQAIADSLSAEYGIKAIFLPTDVRIKEQVHAMINTAADAFGGVDILVNNAWGGGTFCRAEDKTDEDIAHGLNMNLWPGFWSMKAAFPYMKAKNWGRIINICSINGTNAIAGTLEYNIGKEALRTLTRTMAREWAPYQICANAICPAAATAPAARFAGTTEEAMKNATDMTPMGRVGDPDKDIAGVALFLAGEDARYLTGNTLMVDGGTHINGYSYTVEFPE